jgi:cell fate (sporulation/competence/biofilm development) regulator YmcA (YheA/YmcA/DUF963 family)
MSNKQTQQLLKQLVELTGMLNELAGQELSIATQRKLAMKEWQAVQAKLAEMKVTGEFPVKTSHYNAMVTVKQSRTTEILATDIGQVPAEFLKSELNKRAIRKLDEQLINSVPGLKLEVTEKLVYDVTII